MAKKIYLDGENIKFVDGVQTTPVALSELVGGAHKTTHQDAGDDEISLTGLSGEPADTVNKTGAQTIAGVKTFSDIPLLPANTVETEDIKDANVTGLKLHATLASGWVEANETWTYASASTFTISGDKTGKYSVGMKIKFTQTTAKYFYISAVSYSDPNTTITVNGAGLYTVANAPITSPYYSTTNMPQGFPVKMIPGFVKCRAYLIDNTATNIAHNTPYKVLLDAENLDTGGDFDITTSKFTAPVSGDYLIIGQTLTLPTNVLDGKFFESRIYNNGAHQCSGRFYSSGAGQGIMSLVSSIIYLDKDDFVELYFLHVNTTDTIGLNAGSLYTFINISLISVL